MTRHPPLPDLPDGVTMEVVQANDLDAESRRLLLGVLNNAFAAHHHLFPGPRASPESFQEQVAGHELLIIRVPPHGEPAALALIYPDRGGLYFGMAAVTPTSQRRGYGRALLAAAESEARRRGLPTVWLLAIVELGNAAYYERHGYHVVATERMPEGTWTAAAPFTLVTMHKRV